MAKTCQTSGVWAVVSRRLLFAISKSATLNILLDNTKGRKSVKARFYTIIYLLICIIPSILDFSTKLKVMNRRSYFVYKCYFRYLFIRNFRVELIDTMLWRSKYLTLMFILEKDLFLRINLFN